MNRIVEKLNWKTLNSRLFKTDERKRESSTRPIRRRVREKWWEVYFRVCKYSTFVLPEPGAHSTLVTCAQVGELCVSGVPESTRHVTIANKWYEVTFHRLPPSKSSCLFPVYPPHQSRLRQSSSVWKPTHPSNLLGFTCGNIQNQDFTKYIPGLSSLNDNTTFKFNSWQQYSTYFCLFVSIAEV